MKIESRLHPNLNSGPKRNRNATNYFAWCAHNFLFYIPLGDKHKEHRRNPKDKQRWGESIRLIQLHKRSLNYLARKDEK